MMNSLMSKTETNVLMLGLRRCKVGLNESWVFELLFYLFSQSLSSYSLYC